MYKGHAPDVATLLQDGGRRVVLFAKSSTPSIYQQRQSEVIVPARADRDLGQRRKIPNLMIDDASVLMSLSLSLTSEVCQLEASYRGSRSWHFLSRICSGTGSLAVWGVKSKDGFMEPRSRADGRMQVCDVS